MRFRFTIRDLLWLTAVVALAVYGELLEENPRLHQEVIHGLARRCETVNLISTSKVGKSWLVYALALSIVLGREFLGRFPCERGKVLIVDPELHPATMVSRIKTVSNALSIGFDDFKDDLHVLSLRGKSLDLYDVDRALEEVEPGFYLAIIFDPWYRLLPATVDESRNGQVAVKNSSGRDSSGWMLSYHERPG